MPTAFGEKAVLRIFDPDILLKDIDQLGFAQADLAVFQQFLARTHGIILVTGPTGSGLVARQASSLEIFEAARDEGMRTLREAAIDKVLAGATTVSEMVRVTGR